ncbi:YunC family protein [Lentibacillus halophilus]|uniref:YunC family protein n=1 Tax=Lentibacillus halophilus TaxID=295065 RepID=A0ABP3IV90_9BACI
MVTVSQMEIEGKYFTALTASLPKTNLLVISNDVGYIMCGALDVDLFNGALADRQVIAGRARGVKTIDQLLHAPLEKVTDASGMYGWEPGMTGKDALMKLV